jgi:TolB-like protein/DNA-binding winged helix-turn-helix (wHTH) protein/cytochrome c-type biogenesis protein CcmH/NrfG
MSANDADSPGLIAAKQLRFDRYVLDLDRGCLLLDGNEIVLRPKTFAVLLYLVENPGRLVSKDDLFAAVWRNLAVTDDTLVQSIGELRRALGDDGPRLIKTIPRRGYRLESAVSVVAPTGPSVTGVSPDSAASHDGVQASKAVIPVHAWTLLTARRGGLVAALTLVVLLVAAALLAVRPEWRFPGSRSGGQPAKTAESGAKPAIAILPLANPSDDSAREYFADGLTQDIINALGRFPELTVMSWNAISPYKGRPAKPAEIARSLAVRYQVEGSVRRTGDRLRVNAQLVDTNGQVLWSASFDEALVDIFSLQDKIAKQIAGTLAIRVTQIEQRRVLTKPTDSLEAYDYVLRARPALQRPARASIVEARVLLRRAIEIDQNYAAAYAALAETYFAAVSMGWAESPTEFMSRAQEMANKALSLDDSDVRAHIILGRIHIFYQRYEEAKAELDHATAINPSDANALAGRGNILMWSGQTDAAIETLELAQRIDPELNPLDRMALSLAYYLKGRYDAAIEQAELNLRKTTGANFSRVVLAAAYAQLGRSDDAARVVTTIHRIDPTFDAQEFGTKFLNAADLKHLRDGLRKADLSTEEASRR